MIAIEDKSLQRAFRRYRGRILGDTSGACPRLPAHGYVAL